MWVSDVPRPPAAAATDAGKPTVTSTPMAAVLPILRRRAARRGMLLAVGRWHALGGADQRAFCGQHLLLGVHVSRKICGTLF